MCNKIEELEKKIAYLEKMNDLLRTLVKKKDARIQELHEDYDELNDISIELTQSCDELKKENESLKVTIHGYIQENFDLYNAKEKLEKANNILTEECNKALMLNDKHGGEAKDLKGENDKLRNECDELKKQLANALDLYDERGEIVEKHEELKASLKTILNFIYGVDTDGDKIEKLERENELLRQTNIELVNHFGGDTDSIIRSIMVNGGKI